MAMGLLQVEHLKQSLGCIAVRQWLHRAAIYTSVHMIQDGFCREWDFGEAEDDDSNQGVSQYTIRSARSRAFALRRGLRAAAAQPSLDV